MEALGPVNRDVGDMLTGSGTEHFPEFGDCWQQGTVDQAVKGATWRDSLIVGGCCVCEGGV